MKFSLLNPVHWCNNITGLAKSGIGNQTLNDVYGHKVNLLDGIFKFET